MVAEPIQAFPHLPPSDALRERYASAFCEQREVNRWSKNVFDGVLGAISVALFVPLFLSIAILHLGISAAFESERGPLVVSYNAISQGRQFRKFKFRVVRKSHVDTSAAKLGDWKAYAAEWNPNCRTFIDAF